MEKQKVSRQLRYEFSTDEMKTLGNDLALKNQELRRLEEEKSSVSSDYGSRIKVSKEQLNALSDKVANGYEVRDTACEVDYHTPERNKKQFTRLDTGEQWVEVMLDYDHNLFNQWERKEQEKAKGKFGSVKQVKEVFEQNDIDLSEYDDDQLEEFVGKVIFEVLDELKPSEEPEIEFEEEAEDED